MSWVVAREETELMSCLELEPGAQLWVVGSMWGAGERYFVVRSVSDYPTSGTYRHHQDPRFCHTFVCFTFNAISRPLAPLAIPIRIRKHGNSPSPPEAPRPPSQLTIPNSRRCGPTETQSARPS